MNNFASKRSILISLLLTSSVFLVVIPANVTALTYDINSPWDITAYHLNISSTFNVNAQITVKAGVTAEFRDCTFRFQSSTTNPIFVEAGATLILDNCILNSSFAAGNAYVHCDYNSKINIKNSKFINMGTSNFGALILYGTDAIIENSEFLGSFDQIRTIGTTNYVIIRSCKIIGPDNYRFNYGITITTQSNVLIENNNISNFFHAIYGMPCESNITIYKNIINNTYGVAIYLYNMAYAENTTLSYNNIMNCQSSAVCLYNGIADVINNTIVGDWNAFDLYNLRNSTFYNNTISQRPSIYNDLKGILMYNMQENNLFLNNCFYSGEKNAYYDYFDIQGTVGQNTTFSNNLYDDKEYLVYVNIEDYSEVFDFVDNQNIAGCMLYNVTGPKIQNLDLINRGSLKIIESKDIIVNNVNITDPKEKSRILFSENITVNGLDLNTTLSNLWEFFRVDYSNNITINQSSFFHAPFNYPSSCIRLYVVQNFTLSYSNLTNGFAGVYLDSVNGSSFVYNVIKSYYTFQLYDNCLYNSFSYNDMIKWQIYSNPSDAHILLINENLVGNTWDYNHWQLYTSIRDISPKDGIGDDPYIAYSEGPNLAVDNFPLFIDPDNDDLDSFQEIYLHNTNPIIADTDEDGILDGDEVYGLYGYITNPLSKDSDVDGLTDFEEVMGIRGYITNPNSWDTDGDLFSDIREITYGTDPTDADNYPGGLIDDGKIIIQDDQEEENENFHDYSIPMIAFILIAVIGAVGLIMYIYSRKGKRDPNNGGLK